MATRPNGYFNAFGAPGSMLLSEDQKAEARARFDREHPFASSAMLPEEMRAGGGLVPAAAPAIRPIRVPELDAAGQFLKGIGAAGVDASGQPVGSTGGAVPMGAGDRARWGAVRAEAPSMPAAPGMTPAASDAAVPRPTGARALEVVSAGDAALGAVVGAPPVPASFVDTAGRRARPMSSGVPVLDNAVALEDLGRSIAADRETGHMAQQGLSFRQPGETAEMQRSRLGAEAYQRSLTSEPPEQAANRLDALQKRLVNSVHELEAAGVAARPVLRSTDANGRPVLASVAPKAPTEIDRIRTVAQGMADLGRAAMSSRNQPRLVNLGTDSLGRPVEGVQDAQGNFSRITSKEETEPAAAIPFEINGRKFFKVGSQIMNDSGDLVNGQADKPLDPLQANMLLTQYQSALEQASTTGSAWDEFASTAERRRTNARQRANLLASRLGYQLPFPEDMPAAATRQTARPALTQTAAGPVTKLYQTAEGQVRFPKNGDLLKGVQQALDDGAIDEASARQLLEANGYRRRQVPAK